MRLLTHCITICLATLTLGNPVSINSTIANIENYLGNLAESLVSRGEINSTEHYQSADGHTRIEILPAQTTTLQDILFHPIKHRPAAENKTEQFNNSTKQIDLINEDPVTEFTATEHRETEETTTAAATVEITSTEVSDTTTVQILKAIPTTIVAGTTKPSTVVDTSTNAINTTTNIDSTEVAKTENVSVEIVTPQNTASEGNVTSTTFSTTETESESKEVLDKVKEVQAEPVILTVGV